MEKTAKLLSRDGTREITIDGVDYAAHRFCGSDGNGHGRIDLEHLANGALVARVTFDGVSKAMDLETIAGPVARSVVDRLLELADEGLA